MSVLNTVHTFQFSIQVLNWPSSIYTETMALNSILLILPNDSIATIYTDS